MKNEKLSYTQSYQNAVATNYKLLHDIVENKNLNPEIIWHNGWCEVRFALNISKDNFETYKEEVCNEKIVK